MTDLDELVASAIESTIVGPDDVLVLSFEQDVSPAEFERLRETILDHRDGLRGRVLLVAGAKALVVRDGAKAVAE